MPSYEITAVSDNVRDWESQKGGAMKAYRVVMRDDHGTEVQNVEWSRKVSSAAPTVGQKVEGTIDMEAQFGPKFKATPSGAGGFGGGRPESPETRRSIAMQHAQKCAVEALRLAAEHGQYQPPNAGDVATHVKTIAKVLYDQVQEVAA